MCHQLLVEDGLILMVERAASLSMSALFQISLKKQ